MLGLYSGLNRNHNWRWQNSDISQAMHLKGLNLNLLVILDALLTERNTTYAGQRLYLSQSATSGALAQLREFFGDQLLVPSGPKMVLTPLAESLIDPVREIVTKAENLIDKTSAFDPAKSTRRFVLNMSDATAVLLLSKGLPRIRKLAPAIQIEVVSYNERIPEIIEQGEVDFIEVPDILVSQYHPSEPFFEDEYVCIAWSGNRLLKKHLSLEQFRSLGHVTTRFLRRKGHLGEFLLRDSGIEPRYELIVPVFGMMPHAVVRTNMIALTTRKIAEYYAEILPLRIFPSPVKLRPLKQVLQWNRLHEHDEGTQWLRRILIETLNPKTG
ncbi:MAG TPA: LysR family transcriptional regulator [Terriglobales bacterium]|nr:LysR family transcriptional regulator [Terriglobales bacterium]